MTNDKCPSKLQLATLEAEERLESIAAHLAGCARCTQVVGDLSGARAEILGTDPEGAARLATRRLFAEVDRRQQEARGRRFAWVLRWMPAALVPAAGLAFFAMQSGSLQVPPATPAVETNVAAPAADGVRAKGFALAVTCKRGAAVFDAEDGATYQPGDRLQFQYATGQPGYVMVFGVDDQGRISPYYDDDQLRSVPAGAGAGQRLPGSIELDDHRGAERIFALFSRAPLAGESVRAAVAEALARAGGDVVRADRLLLGAAPADVQQTSLLLKKP